MTHVAIDTAVGAVLEETLALSGTRTISCLADGDGAKGEAGGGEQGSHLHSLLCGGGEDRDGCAADICVPRRSTAVGGLFLGRGTGFHRRQRLGGDAVT